MLFHLDASKNKLKGAFPDFLGDLTRLEYVFLSLNAFDGGPIPESFSKLPYMRELSLKSTNRTGPIPSFVGNYSNLKLLDLDQNNFNGPIPESLGNLTKLEFLLLNRNPGLTGGIPNSFTQLSNLRTALFDRTGLTGSLNDVCALKTFNEEKGDLDGDEYITADCAGDPPRMTCPCCTTCCNPSDPDDECHVNDAVANLIPEWEYVFNRYDYNFGKYLCASKAQRCSSGTGNF